VNGTWLPYRPAPVSYVGADGDTVVSIGAENLKWIWEFTGHFQKVGVTGWVSKSDMDGWGAATTRAARMVTFVDVNGVSHNAAWIGDYKVKADTGEAFGNAEWYTVDVKMRER
jgi:hypothetical protein